MLYNNFMIGKIKSKGEIAEGTLRVDFEITEPVSFKSGQYMFVTLKNPPYTDEKGNKRQFSINNSPNTQGILTMTTRITESAFKRSLKELPLGSEVEIGPIAGVFTLPEDTAKPLVFIAGGIGITPFLSMLEYIKEEGLPYKITLIYSNRNQASTAYLAELKNLASLLPNFKLILTMTEDNSWEGERRLIDSKFITEYFPDLNASFYMVVGPPGMVEAVSKALAEAGVKPENIKKENFTGY